MKTDVLIVGGGPTGLMMGILLQRCGIKFRIVDKGPEQARESRALGIQSRSLELFESLGLENEFLQRGQIASGAKFFLSGKERLDLKFSDLGRKDTHYPFIFFLSQAETEKILIEDLAKNGIVVERETSLVKLEQDGSLVRATVSSVKGNSDIECDYLVGCDGSHSMVRSELGLIFEGGAYSHDFIMADTKVNWELSHDKLMVFIDGDNIGVHFPLKNEQLSRVLTVRRDERNLVETKETTSFPATLEEIEYNFNLASRMNVKLTDPQWVTRFKVHHRCVNKMRVGRVFLAGDAAHIHSPLGAQGMNTGLQDAANLAWKLARVLKGKAGKEILDSYEEERLPIARHLLNFTDRLFSLVTSRNKIFIKLRNYFLPVLTRIMSNSMRGRQFMFGFISQLGIRYHENSVVGLNGGKRMPNEKLSNGRDIFSYLKGYSFHLLVFGDGPFETNVEGLKVHFLPPCQFKSKGMVLVRPDGYIETQTDQTGTDKIFIPSLMFQI